jgi:signal peptide peptidase SppA
MSRSPRDPANVRAVYDRAGALGVAPLLLGGSPWLIDRDVLDSVLDAAALPVVGGAPAQAAAPSAPAAPTGGVAVIPLTGVLTPQGSFLSFLFGGAPGGLQGFRDQLDAAVASSDVSTILLDVDSPGGLVDQVPETAADVREANAIKPVVAIADTKMLSGAYWIASQASEIIVTPSGQAGSIGVYRVHVDASGLNDQMGLKVTYIAAGKHKTEGNPDEPLASAAKRAWQVAVDDIYGLFVDDVAAGRGVTSAAVAGGFGEGRSLGAQRAVDAGLADRVATYDDVLSGLLGQSPSQEPAQAAAAALEQRVSELTSVVTGVLDGEMTTAEARVELGLPAAPPEEPPDPELSDDERLYRARLALAR